MEAWAALRTLIYDLQRHRIVDLLPDRQAATLAAWLADYPEIAIIARESGIVAFKSRQAMSGERV